MNSKYLVSVFVLFFFMISCGESWIEKPEGLLSDKQMVDMLVDLHIANSMFQNKDYKTDNKIDLKSEDYYYSVLNKYEVADSVFEKSIVYYSNFPKDFEKIYATVLDKVSQIQEEYNEKDSKPVNLGTK